MPLASRGNNSVQCVLCAQLVPGELSVTEQEKETIQADNDIDLQEQEPEATSTAEGLSDIEAKLAETEARAQDNWDQLLRTRAEMENMRRRTERDLENAHKFALEKFAAALLPVKDSLEMGQVAAQAENANVESLREGTELTLKMFEQVMDKFNIIELNPLDEAFNPEYHQAMSMVEVADKAPNTVINVMQKGYSLNDRLIRPAMVVVSKAPAQDTPEPGTNINEKA